MLFNSNVHLVKGADNLYNIVLGHKDKSTIEIGYILKFQNEWLIRDNGGNCLSRNHSSLEEAFKAFELLCYPKETI